MIIKLVNFRISLETNNASQFYNDEIRQNLREAIELGLIEGESDNVKICNVVYRDCPASVPNIMSSMSSVFDDYCQNR